MPTPLVKTTTRLKLWVCAEIKKPRSSVTALKPSTYRLKLWQVCSDGELMCVAGEGHKAAESTSVVESLTTSPPAFSSLQWTQYGDKEYLFVMDEHRRLDLSRDAAAKDCSERAVASSLITIDSEHELGFVTRHIRVRVIAEGQEFAHEQWWTAGKARAGRWVWDVLGYPQGTLIVAFYCTVV